MSDPAKYRTKEELEEYKKQDPIEQVKHTILKKQYATDDELIKIDKRLKDEVMEAVTFAEESAFPPAADAYTDIYAESGYPYLEV